jgi:hypothetical protein
VSFKPIAMVSFAYSPLPPEVSLAVSVPAASALPPLGSASLSAVVSLLLELLPPPPQALSPIAAIASATAMSHIRAFNEFSSYGLTQ